MTIYKLTNKELDDIISGVVDGVPPTTQEIAMAVEIQENRKVVGSYRVQPLLTVLPDYVFHTMAVRWPLTAEQIKRLCRELQLEMEKHARQPDEQA